MESKKTPQADLTKYRSLVFGFSTLLTMSLIITAFEWKTYGDGEPIVEKDFDNFDPFLEVRPTVIEPPKVVKAPPVLIEVKTEEEITKELDIIDVEMPDKSPDIVFTPIETAPEVVDDEPISIVESPAEPEGGMVAFLKDIAHRLEYPAQARRMQVEGKVFIEFVINKDGTLSDIKVIKGIGAGCDEEALRTLQTAPRWKPGKQRGVPVRQRMVLPITFKLG